MEVIPTTQAELPATEIELYELQVRRGWESMFQNIVIVRDDPIS